MISLQAGSGSLRLSGIEGDDAGFNSRVEPIIRRLIRPVRGASWLLGVFDADGDLVEFVLSNAAVDRRFALDQLCAIALPESAEVVNLRVTGDDGQLASSLGAATTIDPTRSIVLVALRPPTASDKGWSKVAQGLQAAVRQIAKAIAAEPAPALEERRALLPPRSADGGFFLLTPQYEVAVEWQPEPGAREFAELVAPEGGRLPPLLERAVRRLTKSWDLARIETCRAGIAYPIPGLALRVAPMRAGGVLIGVFLEAETAPHPIDGTATLFRVSAREREVLHALLDGQTVADIAASLGLAESTVNDYIARLIAKTNSRNRIEMAATLLGWPVVRSGLMTAEKQAEDPAEGSLDEPNGSGTSGQPRVSWRYTIPSRPPTS